MCGISGIIDFGNKVVDESSIKKMMQVQKHRGPDDDGVFIDENIGLGFVRLSILDLSKAGHQPMFSTDGRYTLIYNGEVFNYIELRDELQKYGHKFKTNTDSEVVLSAYIEWGSEMLHRFNGMWALAIYDSVNRQVFFSRDRYGIKPFYYYVNNNEFIFASEIPPLLSVIKEDKIPDNLAIFDYLVFNRTDQTDRTFFSNIKKMPHGHSLTLQLDDEEWYKKIKFKKWYDLKKRVENSTPFRSSEEYKNIFQSAVGLRLRSDVPVGVCLSGGLDSSSIVSTLLKKYNKNDINTFSAIYGSDQFGDESEYINLFQNDLQNMYYTHPTYKTLFNDFQKFIAAHAEPIPSTSPYAQFKVMELAKENVVVTLDGQGADEELAGYDYFFGYYFKDLFKRGNFIQLIKEIGYYIKIHRSLLGLQIFIYFMLPKMLRTRLRILEKNYLAKEFYNDYIDLTEIGGELYGSNTLQEALLNHFEYKLEHLLKWEDRNSMFFSLESRVPFLDYRLVEKTLASKSSWLINKGMTKHILREAMLGILPEPIRIRTDKIGFGTPQDEWFRSPNFVKYLNELIDSDSFKSRTFWDSKKIKKMYSLHLNKKGNYSKEIWKWINLENWFRTFID